MFAHLRILIVGAQLRPTDAKGAQVESNLTLKTKLIVRAQTHLESGSAWFRVHFFLF